MNIVDFKGNHIPLANIKAIYGLVVTSDGKVPLLIDRRTANRRAIDAANPKKVRCYLDHTVTYEGGSYRSDLDAAALAGVWMRSIGAENIRRIYKKPAGLKGGFDKVGIQTAEADFRTDCMPGAALRELAELIQPTEIKELKRGLVRVEHLSGSFDVDLGWDAATVASFFD